jgi:predicted O-methyltransferase YrrM
MNNPWLPDMPQEPSFPHLRRLVLEVRDYAALKKAKRFARDPILDDEYIHKFENLTDLNDRKLLDAQIIGGVCANRSPKTILEIGTAEGHMTALMAQNAPQATVHTVNIPPEEISDGGTFVTRSFERDEIGRYYRERNLSNVRQIYANTATWKPDIGPIDIAFVDGCHDADFVFNDTRKILKHAHPGTVILWHDFNPALIENFEWIADVCRGVEHLYAEGLIKGNILHVRDSWVGYYVLLP